MKPHTHTHTHTVALIVYFLGPTHNIPRVASCTPPVLTEVWWGCGTRAMYSMVAMAAVGVLSVHSRSVCVTSHVSI